MNIAVLEKAFLVLETMTELDRPVSLKELTDVAQLPKPTLHRILQTLTELGYVDQDQARSHYQLTMQLANLGRGQAFEQLKERALPLMESLHQQFNETVNLGVLQGAFIYYIHVIETTKNLRWQVHPGTRDAFYCTALGRAMVAQLPPERQEQLLKRTVFQRRTPNTVATREGLRRVLEETRARIWALDDEENDEGVVCIGVPLIEEARPFASISVSVPKSRLSPKRREEITEALLAIHKGTGASRAVAARRTGRRNAS
jgi:DNA-binding IclR family transcriptional regulator